MSSSICPALERGVKRSKEASMRWTREAAKNGHIDSCVYIAQFMYGDQPHAREVGRVGEATSAEVATLAGLLESHEVPPDVLADVVFGCRRDAQTGNVIYPTSSTSSATQRGTELCIAATTGARLVGS